MEKQRSGAAQKNESLGRSHKVVDMAFWPQRWRMLGLDVAPYMEWNLLADPISVHFELIVWIHSDVML